MRIFRNTTGVPRALLLCQILSQKGRYIRLLAAPQTPLLLALDQPFYCYSAIPPFQRFPAHDSMPYRLARHQLDVPVHNDIFHVLGYDWPMYLPNIVERGDMIALEPSPFLELA
jgi:hypothetical protein